MGTTATTQFLLVTYDPGTLFVMWRPVVVEGVSGYRIFLQPPQGAVQTYDASASANTRNIPVTITGLTGYKVSISVLVNGEPGPQSTPLELITEAVFVLSMVYDAVPKGKLSLVWRAASQGAVSGYVAVLRDVSSSDQWTQSPTDPQTAFDLNLDSTHNYQASVRATGSNGVVQGPSTTPMSVITASTQMLSVVYDTAPSSRLSLRWRAVSDGSVTGYVAVLRDNAGTQWAQNPDVPETKFDQTLDLGKTYQVTVRASSGNGVVQGPATSPLTVITAATQMLSMIYDIAPTAKLSLRWQAVEKNEVTGYVAVLQDGAGTQWAQNPSGPETEFDQVLDNAKTYQASVRASGSNGVVQGPATPLLTAIATLPVLTKLDYNPGVFIVAWTPLGGDVITGCDIIVSDAAQSVSYPGGNTGQVTLPITLDPAFSYTVVARATGSGGIVKGPPSAALIPITAPPKAVYLGCDGTNLIGQWLAPEGVAVTGYSVSLSANGGVIAALDNVTSPLRFDATPVVATSYAMTVRASAGAVIGPSCLPSSGPYWSAQTFTYDMFGRICAACWNGSQTVAWTYDSAGNLLTQTLTSHSS